MRKNIDALKKPAPVAKQTTTTKSAATKSAATKSAATKKTVKKR
jgi:hypothetical protein